MSEIQQEKKSTQFSRWVAIAFGLPWFEITGDLWKIGKKIMRGLANEGMYELLDYETTLELLDTKGKEANLKKWMKVRYLQNDNIAFQDYAWGDTEKILLNYQTSRGKAVDQYKSGYKTYVLLSLREVRNKGDVDEFNISWDIQNGFLKPDGYWSTTMSHRTKRFKVNIIFPKSRPPQRLALEENNHRRTIILGNEFQTRLPDGRTKVTWEKDKPKLHELYVLKWDW